MHECALVGGDESNGPRDAGRMTDENPEDDVAFDNATDLNTTSNFRQASQLFTYC
jgi:hypothetical protein